VSAAPAGPARALRELLPRYAARWARLAAAHPLPSPDPRADGEEGEPAPAPDLAPRPLVYVDAFARSGLHAVERGPGGVLTAVDGERAPSIVRAMLSSVATSAEPRPHVSAVLVDEDPAHLAAIEAELGRHGIGARLVGPVPPAELRDGDVALVEASFAAVAGALGMLADAPAHSLVLLAPPNARALPWPALLSAVVGENADVLLVLPHGELHRQADLGSGPVVDMPPQQRRIVEGFSAMLGDARHGWLSDWRRAEREAGRPAAEAAFVSALVDRLRAVADDGVVKALRIAPAETSDPARVLHLVHVTPRPSHALAMNEVLRELGLVDRSAEAEAARAPRLEPTAAEAAVLELFAPAETHAGAGSPAGADERPVDVTALGERIATEFRGRAVVCRDVLAFLAPGDVTADEAARAMAVLKRGGRAVFRSLGDERAEVEFPSSPVRPRAAGTRTRRNRRAADAGFFASPEEDTPVAE
jgi:hypothetical protein